MKTKLAFTFAASLLCSTAHADTKESDDVYVSDNEFTRVAVKWIEPKSYTDVREANFSSSKFRKHVFNQLEQHLDKLSEDLPTGQKIQFQVIDLDLAGRIEPASFVGFRHSIDDIRVMRNVDIPRIKFTYSLLDGNGEVIKTEDVKLKNMNYLMDSTNLLMRSRPFAHEKRMLTDWFKDELLSKNT